MLPGSDDHVKITGGPSLLPSIALTGDSDTLPISRSCLDAHLERFCPRHRTLTVARGADGHILPRSMAPRTLHVELHAATGLRDLAGPVALRTFTRRFQDPLPTAIGANILARDIEAHHPAPDRRPEGNVDLVLQVRARFRPGLRGSATAAATKDPGKNVFEAAAPGAAGPPATPRIFEHVGKIESSEVELRALTASRSVSATWEPAGRIAAGPATGPRIGFRRGGIDIVRVEADLVVDLAFLGIAQNVVGFGQGLELLLGPFVPGIHVRMILPRQLAERLTDFLRRGAFLHAQNLVVVLLGGSCHVEVSSISSLCLNSLEPASK